VYIVGKYNDCIYQQYVEVFDMLSSDHSPCLKRTGS
jgi:hypothetical protein